MGINLFVSTVIRFIAELSLQISRSTSYTIRTIYLLSKLNMKTSSRRLKPNFSQTHQHKTERLTPDSRQTQTPPDPTIGSTTASFAFLATEVATVRI
jgi:hypothetical protein